MCRSSLVEDLLDHLTNLKLERNVSTQMISLRSQYLHAVNMLPLGKSGLDQFSSHGIPNQWLPKIDGNYQKEVEVLRLSHGADTRRESLVLISTTIIISVFMSSEIINACLSISAAPLLSMTFHGHQLKIDSWL